MELEEDLLRVGRNLEFSEIYSQSFVLLDHVCRAGGRKVYITVQGENITVQRTAILLASAVDKSRMFPGNCRRATTQNAHSKFASKDES